MARKKSISAAQRLASWAVLALVAALAAYVVSVQSRFNPGVLVSLRQGQKAGAGESATGQATGTMQTGDGAQAEGGSPDAASGSDPVQAPGQPTGQSTGLAAHLPDSAPGLATLEKAELFNAQTLSDKIDGKAELYLSSGFKAMAHRAYGAGAGKAKVRIEVYLYEMKSPDAAFAVFSGQRRSGSGKSGLTEKAYATENAVFFTVGPHYVELVADKTGPEARGVLDGLGKLLVQGLTPAQTSQARDAGKDAAKAPPTGGTMADTALFPKQGLREESLRLSVSDVFGVQALNNVYTAEYTLPQGQGTAFLTRRKNVQEAEAMLTAYAAFLSANGYVEKTGVTDLPAGARLYEADGSFEVLMLRGSVLCGVHDAASAKAAQALASLLSTTVK